MSLTEAAEEPSLIEVGSDNQSVVLEETSVAKNYRVWLVSLALPRIGGSPLEIGSGTGDHSVVVPMLRAVDRDVKPPFGQSLFVVARKRG